MLPRDAAVAAPQGQLGLGGTHYAANGNGRSNANAFVKQAYIRINHLGHGKVRLGRFGYLDGTEAKPKDATLAALVQTRIAHRLIGDFGWSAVGRSYDGAQFDYNWGKAGMAYGWLLVAAFLGVGATRWDSSGGIWGASRHALTVGFIAVMVLCVGQRVLPAFAGMRLLWSTRLMFIGLFLLSLRCALRVSTEVLAYQNYANWAWSVLPVPAFLELAGITAFAMNIFGTFILQPSHVLKQSLVVPMR